MKVIKKGVKNPAAVEPAACCKTGPVRFVVG